MSDLELPIRSLAAVITEASVCVALSVTSIIGNSLVCIVAYRNTKLQSTTNLYIIALAVSDLLCETVAMPLASVTLIIGRQDLIDFVCQIQSFVGILTTDVTPATDGLIAFNRYVKIVKTNHYKKIFSPRRSKIWLSCLWLSLLLYLFIAQVTNSANIYPKLCNVLLYLPKQRESNRSLLYRCRIASCFTIKYRYFSY